MIKFKTKVENLMPEAIKYLESVKVPFNIITLKEADSVSRVNSKAMVLVSFIRNESGYIQFTVKDKELYRYTQKLLRDFFGLRITNIDTKAREVTVETDSNKLGRALDAIEILGLKYNLSIVQ